ncbi:hypothetical protein ACFV4N_01935 [Actinosynnema sp. NPDC059797]
MDEFGPDGTQALPPPRFFPDPLAGLVPVEGPPVPDAVPRVVVPAAPVAPVAPVRREPVRRRAPRPAPPAVHAPRAEPKKNRGALVGCLVALVALSGLLFNVLREIIGAVVDLLK